MLPAFVFILSILLVRLHQFSMPLTNIYWTGSLDTTSLSDLFGYWKCLAILAAGGLAVIVMIAAYFKDQVQFKKSFLYIPALIYVVFVLVSLVFSNYRYFALRGMHEHFEGTFVLLSYILMVVFLVNALDSSRRVKMVVFCTLGAAFLVGLLGVTQATGHDFFATATGQKLITPYFTTSQGLTSWEMIDLMIATGQKVYDFAFTEGEVYQTVYNINYVPFYLSLLIPVSAVLFVYCWMGEKRKAAVSVISLALYGLFLYNFFSANSASGYFGLAAGLIAALILFRKNLKRWIKPVVCLIVILGLVMGLTVDRWVPEVKQLIGTTIKAVTSQVYADNTPQIEGDFDHAPGRVKETIDYIDTQDGYMLFSIGGNVLKITRDDEHAAFTVTDGDDNQLYMRKTTENENVFAVLDERFYDYVRLSLEKDENYPYVVFTTVWTEWRFKYDGTRFLYQNRVGKELPLSPVKHAGIFPNYKMGSSRGLIWDTTIPMLKDYIIKGAGADSYAFVYPQSDYATLYSVFDQNYLSHITDKAHNLYMQYWVNTGLISLLAWLTLVGYYLVGAVKYFRKRGFVDFCDFVNGGIFCGIIGFLAVAFFNDGSVNTMPMFYTMLGTGLAINMRDKWVSAEEGDAKAPMNMPEI